MARISWERLAAFAGVSFVVFYIVAFSLGIEVGRGEREILDYYGDSGHRTREAVAFLLLAGAGLDLLVFATALRAVIARTEPAPAVLSSLAWVGGAVGAALLMAGNSISRATAFAAMDDEFRVVPDTRNTFEDAGFLLFWSGSIAAILLVLAVSLAALRYGVLPRWLGWAGLPAAALLTLAFLGFLVFGIWLLAVSVALVVRRQDATVATQPP